MLLLLYEIFCEVIGRRLFYGLTLEKKHYSKVKLSLVESLTYAPPFPMCFSSFLFLEATLYLKLYHCSWS